LFESNRVSFASFQIKPEKENGKELEKEEKAAGITLAQVQKMAHDPSLPLSRTGTPLFLSLADTWVPRWRHCVRHPFFPKFWRGSTEAEKIQRDQFDDLVLFLPLPSRL
jgi:hypothetical protein